jgi:hypothetical protein
VSDEVTMRARIPESLHRLRSTRPRRRDVPVAGSPPEATAGSEPSEPDPAPRAAAETADPDPPSASAGAPAEPPQCVPPDAEPPEPEQRVREAGGPEDRAHYTCSCGMAFTADVSASVACPHCGVEQVW